MFAIPAAAYFMASLVLTATNQNDQHGQALFYFDHHADAPNAEWLKCELYQECIQSSIGMIFGLLLHRGCYIKQVTQTEASTFDSTAAVALYEAELIKTANTNEHVHLTYGELLSKSGNIAKLCQAATDFYEITPVIHTTAPKPTTPSTTVTMLPSATPVISTTTLKPVISTSTAKAVLVPLDCYDVYTNGNNRDGVYLIHPDGGIPGIQAYCDMNGDGGGWTVIQRRQDGSVDFLRDWNTYKTGFGSANGEYWIGNDIIHLLTTRKNYQLRIFMEDFSSNSGYALYDHFSIGDESSKYTLNLTGFHGNRGDSVSAYENGKQFSTTDQDNDSAHSKNCVQTLKGCWWYNKCFGANLNGVYNATEGAMTNIHWPTWYFIAYYSRLKTVVMKIRPVHH